MLAPFQLCILWPFVRHTTNALTVCVETLPACLSLLAQIFEKWRVVDTARLSGERLAEFERDREESNRRYNYAFGVVLSHTSALELQEFSKLVGLGDGVSVAGEARTGSGSSSPAEGQFHTNPMAADGEWRRSAGAMEEDGSVVEFEHANPALDESGASAGLSQLEVRAI